MDDEDVISLHALFTNNNYVKTKFSLSYHSPNSTEGNNNADNVNNASVELWCSHSASTDYDLTGQIVWPVSRLLAAYAGSQRGQDLLRGKKVLELGAGCGLPGLVASRYARLVILTDGSDTVVELLKRNVRDHCFYEDFNQDEHGSNREICNNIVREKRCVEARRLLWGDGIEIKTILERCEGYVDVVFAADVVQWPAVVQPLLHSVKALLWGSNKPIFVLGIVQRAQSTTRLFFHLAEELGFAWKRIDIDKYHSGGRFPEACREFGGLAPEIYEIILTDRSSAPALFSSPLADNSTMVVGKAYEHTFSLPC